MAANEAFITKYGLVPRPKDALRKLPMNFRWEFTRRHPYYLRCWQSAAKYRRSESGPNTVEALDDFCAMQLLGMIGVTGEPQDPQKDFSCLGDRDLSWGSGTVQPMTLRNLLQTLIAALPEDVPLVVEIGG